MKRIAKPKKSLNVMIPVSYENLDLLFPEKVIADRVRAILQLIFFTRLQMKQNDSFMAGITYSTGYCGLLSDTIQTIAGNYYRKIINQMVEFGLIQVKKNDDTGAESFFPGKWSKTYRIHPQYRNKSISKKKYRREKITHPDVIRAVKRHFDNQYARQLKLVESKGSCYADVVKFGHQFCLDITSLEMDIQAGKEFRDKKKELIDESVLMGEATAINEDLIKYCTVDSFGFRLHTQLTSLRSCLRPYLRLKDQPEKKLIMLDIKNSQPFFLSLLFFKSHVLNYINEFEPVRQILDGNRNERDVETYYDDCAAGEFYKKILVVIGEKEDAENELTEDEKKELKELLFQHIFYSHPDNHNKDERVKERRFQIETRFGLVYKNVLANLKSLKRIKKEVLPFISELNRKGKKRKIFTVPCAMANRLEVRLVYDFIGTTMFKMDTPVLTIHDAFIVSEESHAVLLMQILKQVFVDQLKVKAPKVKITELATGRELYIG